MSAPTRMTEMERRDLLLAEYQQYSDAYWKNEEAGERRLTFFITLTTAIIGALVALRAKDVQLEGIDLPRLTAAALLGVLIFGVATFLRILQRDRVTDEYKGILVYLRDKMRKEADLGDYVLPFLPRRHWLLRGGLAVTTALLNSFLFSLLVVAAPVKWASDKKIGVLVAVFLLSFVLHAILIRQRRSERPSQTFRAGVGAIIFNAHGDVLALERSDVKGAWQLPQGGIEWGETPDEAVTREIEEETGIPARLLTRRQRLDGLHAYELPERLRSNKTGRGQVQYWFRFRFTGTDQDIRLAGRPTHGGGEFMQFRWMPFASVVDSVVDFKKPVYHALLIQLQASKDTLPSRAS
jgi:putative (di)nucleoside polyphosphate hydrolase